jgi:hypothetical protein
VKRRRRYKLSYVINAYLCHFTLRQLIQKFAKSQLQGIGAVWMNDSHIIFKNTMADLVHLDLSLEVTVITGLQLYAYDYFKS